MGFIEEARRARRRQVNEVGSRERRFRSRMATVAGVALLLTVTLLVLTSVQKDPKSAGSTPEPRWLMGLPARVQVAYAWAAANRGALQYISCYCGCGDASHGFHQGNADCYGRVHDGQFVPDHHASNCSICIAITLDTMRMKAQGRTLGEIRREIDGRYAALGMTPTPTPFPPN